MTRETRGSASAGTAVPTDASASTKRKRQPSIQADQPKPTPIKVTLPSPASLGTVPKVKLNISPSKDAPGAKRQRISLKVNGNKAGKGEKKLKSDVADEEGHAQEEDVIEEDAEVGDEHMIVGTTMKEDQVDEQKEVVNALGRDVRDALALVLAQMATNLPRPLSTVLTLFLPPSFEQKQENTLAYILKQGSLTWERLVDILHIFSTHLLQPCAYPSPFPPLSHIHASIPPLAPHQPPHAIYDFCASLRDLVLSIEPGRRKLDDPGAEIARLEKWALMMKVPPGGVDQKGGGEWWTGTVDWRETEKAKTTAEEGERDQGLMARLAADGNKLGFASAVSIASIAGTSQGMTTIPKLGESVIQAASLKAQEWKEMLKRRKGGFGSYYKPVTIPRSSPLPWTPSFAPTFDSHFASGGVGYWSTVEAMHQRNRYNGWMIASKNMDAEGVISEGYWGSIEVKQGEKSAPTSGEVVVNGQDGNDALEDKEKVKRETSDILNDNAAWLNELLGWQELRTRKGEIVVGDREEVLAKELLHSLIHLSEITTPSELISDVKANFAHAVSKRLIHASGPVHRGTLDPRRPQAMHDNTTIRARPTAPAAPPSIAQQLAGTPTRPISGQINPYTPSPSYPSSQPQQQGRQSYGYSATPQSASYAGNGQTPQPARQPYYPSGAGGTGYRTQTPTYQQYTPQPQVPNGNNTIYSRAPVASQPQIGSPTGAGMSGMGTAGQNQYTRPGIMPSGLRQSFGPGADGGSGSLTGGGYYAGMNRTT